MQCFDKWMHFYKWHVTIDGDYYMRSKSVAHAAHSKSVMDLEGEWNKNS